MSVANASSTGGEGTESRASWMETQPASWTFSFKIRSWLPRIRSPTVQFSSCSRLPTQVLRRQDLPASRRMTGRRLIWIKNFERKSPFSAMG